MNFISQFFAVTCNSLFKVHPLDAESHTLSSCIIQPFLVASREARSHLTTVVASTTQVMSTEQSARRYNSQLCNLLSLAVHACGHQAYLMEFHSFLHK